MSQIKFWGDSDKLKDIAYDIKYNIINQLLTTSYSSET